MSKQQIDPLLEASLSAETSYPTPSCQPHIFVLFSSEAGRAGILTLLLLASHPEGLRAHPRQTCNSDNVHQVWRGTGQLWPLGHIECQCVPRSRGVGVCVCKCAHIHRFPLMWRGLSCVRACVLTGMCALSLRTLACRHVTIHMRDGTHVHVSICLRSRVVVGGDTHKRTRESKMLVYVSVIVY